MSAVYLASISGRAGDQIGEFLPRLGAALVLLLAGLLIVRLLTRLLQAALLKAGVDSLAERARIHDTLARIGLERSLTRTVAALLRITGSVAVILIALSTLGLQTLDQALNRAVLFLPSLVAAVVLLALGAGLGGLARERVDRLAYQMDLRGPLGAAAHASILGVALILALGQLGVPTTILVVVAGVTLAGAALTLALAFGLGSRDLAAELAAGRYVGGGGLQVGDEITVDALRGEIVALDSTSLMLRTEDGRRFRVPNSSVMRAPVELH
ncbi:hypothetical protein DSM112329_00319 [Paraconexibacter sp. AEG42_29]|uniref:Mechanosensitive ion channel MscS domain-containing protein n=1 Tax=Paraconexibacter sp. AEG42_29 TaxID=2997339 RepID=A0AAU7AQ59_9ACTN